MGPPQRRSLVLIAIVLTLAFSALLTTFRAAHHRPITTLSHSRHRALSVTPPLVEATNGGVKSHPPPPPRRTITLNCAKAGPHWNKDLPTHETPAIELEPYSWSEDAEDPEALPLSARRRRLEPFAMREVALANGTHVGRAAATNRKYLYDLRADDLLYAWRRQAGLPQPPGARPLRGWESPGSELRGHVLGHWLSASALVWASTGDPALRKRMSDVVAALSECQERNGWLAAFPETFLDRVEALRPVWAPYYTLHKLLQGLLDQHEIVGSVAALRLALKLAHYVGRRVHSLLQRRSLAHHWTTLNKEFGGLNDVLWKLYLHQQRESEGGAERLSGQSLRAIASHFDRPCLLGPLAAGQDTLSHMHANTQLPVLAGAHTRYEATGDDEFRRLASFFVRRLLTTRTFATGGSSIGEYWTDANRLGELVAAGEGTTTQESCSTHNLVQIHPHPAPSARTQTRTNVCASGCVRPRMVTDATDECMRSHIC